MLSDEDKETIIRYYKGVRNEMAGNINEGQLQVFKLQEKLKYWRDRFISVSEALVKLEGE